MHLFRPAPTPARRAAASPAVLVLAVLALLVPSACGSLRLGPSDASGGALAGTADLDGASYVVAGGGTEELHILCQLTIAAVQAAGARAEDQCGKVGAADVRRSAAQTEVDTGWAYAGRDWRTAADLDDAEGTGAFYDPPATPDDATRADAARGVTRLAPSAFSDVDAMVVAGSGPLRGARSLDDPALRSAVVCAAPDAASDPTRLPAVRAAYGLVGPVATMDGAAVLAGVATGRCGLGEVGGTSGRIPGLGLLALADDRGALASAPSGRGGVSPILRTDVFAAHPQVAAVLGAVTARLDDAAIRRMNAEVDLDGRDSRDAARRWLISEGLIARG